MVAGIRRVAIIPGGGLLGTLAAARIDQALSEQGEAVVIYKPQACGKSEAAIDVVDLARIRFAAASDPGSVPERSVRYLIVDEVSPWPEAHDRLADVISGRSRVRPFRPTGRKRTMRRLYGSTCLIVHTAKRCKRGAPCRCRKLLGPSY